MGEIVYQYWQHVKTGEIYAVELQAGHVWGAYGPLAYNEIGPYAGDYNFNDEDGEWIDDALEMFRVYTRTNADAENYDFNLAHGTD